MSIQILCPEGHPILIRADQLGKEVLCPRCFVCVLAQLGSGPGHNARPEKGKSRRSRDDDDDDEEEDEEDDEEEEEEEEKPRRKKPARKKEEDEDEDEEDEKPRRKKPAARKKEEEEEEDEDEEEDEEAEDEDAEVEQEEEKGPMTPKLRRLQTVNIGLGFMLASVLIACVMVLMSALVAVLLGGLQSAIGVDIAGIFAILFTIARFASHALNAVGLTLGFFAPPKSETRGTLIAALLFGGLHLAFAIIAILGYSQLLVPDVLRARTFGDLFSTLAGVNEFLFFLLSVVYLKKLAGYLKDPRIASEPIPLFIEITLWYVLPLVGLRIIVGNINFGQGNMDGFTMIIVGVYCLFCLGALVRAGFLLYRWAFLIIAVKLLVTKVIDDR